MLLIDSFSRTSIQLNKLFLVFLCLISLPAWSVTVQVRVERDNDDAEELISDGDMYRGSSDLELVHDNFNGGLQIVGMRFQNVNVPQGATISSAYIQFEGDESHSGTTNITIVGQDADNANSFANNDYNISSRTQTSASVDWSPSSWSTNGDYQTPDISSIIQEIVNRSGWSANNDMVIIIKPGSGCTNSNCRRTAEAHDGESNNAPLLVIDYSEDYDVSSVHGACGVDNLLVVEFDGTIDAQALNTSYYSLNSGSVDSVTQQSSDTVVLSVSGITAGQSYTLTVDGVDHSVDFTGLTGHYFDQRSGGGGSKVDWTTGLFTGNEFIRKDSQLNFSWGSGTPTIFPGASGDNNRFSIRWNGYVVPTTAGSYEFRLYSDDGMRMDFEGTEIINDWSLHGGRFSGNSSAQSLTDGVGYPIEVEFFEHTGNAHARLQWRRDGGSWEYVPGANLSSCATVDTSLPSPVYEYRMDESSWSAASGDVVDTSGNSNNGTARNGLTTTSTAHICRAGDFDGVDDYIEHSGIDNTLSGTASMSFWIKTTQTGDNTGWRAPGISGVELAGGSDDIFWGWLDTSGRIGLSVANDFSTKSTVAINDDNFHHVVLTRNATSGAYKIYIDGSLNQSGTLASGIIGTSFSRIGSIEDTGGSPEYFQGQLDELKIYDRVLTDANVTELYNETRPCGGTPIAHYTFEQTSWTTGPVVIDDETGNGNTGISVGGAVTHPTGYVCKGVTIPDNSAAGTIDAINSRQDINDQIGNAGTLMLWYRAEENWVGSGDRTLIDASTSVFGNANDKYFFLTKQNDGRLRFALEDSSDADFNLYTSANSISAGTWVHVAVAWDMTNDTMSIYVNGSQAASQSISSNNVLGDLGDIYFGDNSSSYVVSSPNSANGRLDEIRLYDSLITEAEIAYAMAESHDCASCTLGSFNVSQSIYALACPTTRATVDITAMCDDGTTTKTDYVGTVALSGPATSTFYDQVNGGSVVTNYTFDVADAGEKTFYLYYNNENPNVQTTVSDATASVASTAGTGTDFRANGFTITASSSALECNSNGSITLTAIGLNNTGSGQECEVLTGFTGSKNFDVWFEVDTSGDGNPNTNRTMTVNGSSVTADSDPNADNVSLNFTNGISTFNFSYADVGSVSAINFQHDDAPYDGSVYSAMSQSSAAIVFYPASFTLTAQNASSVDLNATTATGTPTHVAGAAFNLEVQAQCASGSDPQDYQPNSANNFQAALERTGPTNAGASDGLLTVKAGVTISSAIGASYAAMGISPADFSSGGYSFSGANYSEVGLVQLSVRDSDYFGVTTIPTVSANIGRFIPDHFRISGNTPAFDNGDGTWTCNMTYQDQPFEFSVDPIITLTAYNANDQVTQNYGGDYWQHNSTFLNRSYTNQAAVSSVLDIDTSGAAWTYGDIANYDGDGTATLSDDVFTHEKTNTTPAADDAAFSTDIDLALTTDDLRDDDNVCVKANAAGSCSGYTFTGITGNEIRYGRLNIENAFGPETEALEQEVVTQYWNGTQFITNTDDGCTQMSTAMITTTPDGSPSGSGQDISIGGGETDLSFDVTFTSGDGNFEYTAPGAGNTESLTIDLNLSSQPWLQYDWNGDGTVEDPPTKTVTFGQFRGHDRVIFWEEITY